MELTFNSKMSFVFITAVVMCYCNLMSHVLSIVAQQRRYINPNTCVYDPLLAYFNPFSQSIFGSRFSQVLVTGILGFGLDACVLVVSFLYATKIRTPTVIPCILLFHIVRAVALNIVIFPEPINYVFMYPGFPSLTAAYDRTNDLYFSGHIGTVTVLALDSLLSRHYRVGAFLAGFWVYTLFSLLVLGIHYTNDVVIGVVASVLVTRFIHSHRYVVTLGFLRTYCFLAFILQVIFECRLFRRMPKDERPLTFSRRQEEQMMRASRSSFQGS